MTSTKKNPTRKKDPKKTDAVKPSDTMRCRVSVADWTSYSNGEASPKKDDFQKIIAPNLFWEAIFLVDETPTVAEFFFEN